MTLQWDQHWIEWCSVMLKYRDGAAQVLAYDKRAGILARAGSFLSQSNEQTVNGNTGGVFNFVTNPLKWLESR